MRCLEATRLMSLQLDSLLAEAQERALRGHLSTCGACRAEWERMQSLDLLLAGSELSNPSPMFSTKVMARIKRHRMWVIALRRGGVFCLVIIVLLALGIIPLMAVSAIALGNPSIVHVLVGALLSIFEVLGTLLRALQLLLRALLSGPSLFILMGCIALAVSLTLGGVRLVVRPARLR